MKKIRKQIRLSGYDYSQPGYYFITICAQDRRKLFGNIINKKMKLNKQGKMIDKWWLKMEKRFKNIVLDEYQIMPNHVHLIIRPNAFRKRIWQRGFYEHIVRDESELNKIKKHIQLNPIMWERDRDNLEILFNYEE